MEHAYLKFDLSSVVGLNTTRAKSIINLKTEEAIFTADAQDVVGFSSNLSKIVKRFSPPKEFLEQDEIIQITDLVASPNNQLIAVGYSNGEICVFDAAGERINHFVGHRRAISCLKFHPDSNILASGSLDNDVILWDTSADSGICRLSAHQNAVTDLEFIPNTPYLVSSSKDTHIRVWDIEIQTCIQTITSAASEVWTLCYLPLFGEIIAAGKSSNFFVFTVDPTPADQTILSLCEQQGKNTKHRIQSIVSSADGKLLAFATSGKTIDIYNVFSTEEMEKKRKRREHRVKATGGTAKKVEQFVFKQTITFDSKVYATIFDGHDIIVSLSNNSIQILRDSVSKGEKDSIYQMIHTTAGHQTDVRCLSLNEGQIISAGDGEVRIWDIQSKQCVSRIECGYAMSLAVLPGGRFFLIGTKDGNLELVDSSSAAVYDRVHGHSGCIWSIAIAKNCTEIATGSEDHEVHFWGIKFVEDRPVLVHKRTLKVSDEVFAVAYNPDASVIAVALLDSTVRLFHTDTLNFHLSLYGSQLPVTSVNFSDDGALIVTASADKNLRIWGSEFGDCHRSLWAHDSAVVTAQFIPGTHLAWTAGRDGVIKLWDCDRFLCVQKLYSHIAEVWALAVSPNGSFLISAGRDKGLRIWERTQKQLFFSEQKEAELERRMETENADRLDRTVAALRGSVLGGAVVDTAARLSVEAVTHGDVLADALTAADGERDSPGSNPLMRDTKPSDYVLKTVRQINRAHMDVVMQSLPFNSAMSLMRWAIQWLRNGVEVELTVRSLSSLIKFHRKQMEASSEVAEIFTEAKEIVHRKVDEMRERCGSNLAALKLISHEMEK